MALAPDLYHGPTASTIEEAKALMSTLNTPKAQADVTSALEELRAQPGVAGHPVGALGFSLGAAYATWLAAERGAEIGAVVLYYGTGDENYGKARAAFLGHFAENDPYEDSAWVREVEKRLRAANLDVEFHVYRGVGHWFFEDDRRDAYDPGAARLSWDRTLAFLRQRLR